MNHPALKIRAIKNTVEPVSRDSILPNWGSYAPLLERVIEKMDPGFSADDVVQGCLAGAYTMWNINNWMAIAITQPVQTPQFKTLTVIYLSGDGLKLWKDEFAAAMTAEAQREQCKFIEWYGREGWRSIGREFGMCHSFTVMRFPVDGWKQSTDGQ